MRSSASLLAALLLISTAASAQEGEASEESERLSAPAFMVKVREGIGQVVAGDHEAAQAAFRGAIQADANQSLPHYHLGESLRQAGSLDEALASYQAAARMAGEAGDVAVRGRALQGAAMTLERTPEKLQEAREAWAQLAAFADSHRDVLNPTVPRARVEAIDKVLTMEQQYIEVRNRIAAREAANAAGGEAGSGN